MTGIVNGILPKGYGLIVFNRGTAGGNKPFHPQAPLDKNGIPVRYYSFIDSNKRIWSAPSRFGYSGNENQEVDFEVVATLADSIEISHII